MRRDLHRLELACRNVRRPHTAPPERRTIDRRAGLTGSGAGGCPDGGSSAHSGSSTASDAIGGKDEGRPKWPQPGHPEARPQDAASDRAHRVRVCREAGR